MKFTIILLSCMKFDIKSLKYLFQRHEIRYARNHLPTNAWRIGVWLKWIGVIIFPFGVSFCRNYVRLRYVLQDVIYCSDWLPLSPIFHLLMLMQKRIKYVLACSGLAPMARIISMWYVNLLYTLWKSERDRAKYTKRQRKMSPKSLLFDFDKDGCAKHLTQPSFFLYKVPGLTYTPCIRFPCSRTWLHSLPKHPFHLHPHILQPEQWT